LNWDIKTVFELSYCLALKLENFVKKKKKLVHLQKSESEHSYIMQI